MKPLASLFCPDRRYDRISRVSLEPLWELGIRGLILDLDNTLVPWRGSEIADDLLDWAARARRMGFQLCIASNTRRYGRLERIAERLGALWVRGVSKPLQGGFHAAARAMGLPPDQIAVIGDQVMTDILGARRFGAMAILVERISNREFALTKVNRALERLILAVLSRAGALPPLERGGSARPEAE